MSEKLNEKQKRFCDLYISPDGEFFVNGVQSYVEAYNVDTSRPNWYKSSAASASRLLKDVKICSYINEKLEEEGLNDQFVDKQLSFLITQYADFKSKLGAIKEYNSLKQRITQKTDITTGGDKLSIILDACENRQKNNKQELEDKSPLQDN